MKNKKYIIRFANELLNFRILEFKSLASMFKLDYAFIVLPSEKPFILLETNNEEGLLKVMQRSVLAQNLYELWAAAPTYEQFHNELKLCSHIQDKFYSNCSFRILVETFCKKISLQNKVERIESLDYLPFDGEIKLKDPEVSFHYFEYYGSDQNHVPQDPQQIFFGKWIADSNRKCIFEFSLQKRKFIANTSMEPILSFLMSNIACVSPNDIVYDPFVGSGSLLVSAAYNGAYVCGTDIDYNLLHAIAKPSRYGMKQREKDESVLANLKQYKLECKYLDVMTGDSSLPIFRNDFEFDAIISDPPYGRRESRERIGTKKTYKIPEELLAAHIPSKLEYFIEDIYRDLLHFASKHLKLNGRILFWAPFTKKPADEEIASLNIQDSLFDDTSSVKLEQQLKEKFCDPRFKFISYAEQILSCRYSRILIVMEKIE